MHQQQQQVPQQQVPQQQQHEEQEERFSTKAWPQRQQGTTFRTLHKKKNAQECPVLQKSNAASIRATWTEAEAEAEKEQKQK